MTAPLAPPSAHRPTRARVRGVLAAAGVLLCAATLVSCAPEPGDIAGTPSKEELAEGKGGSEGSWSETNPDGVGEKQTEIPASFPADRFVIPEGAVIDDIGERSAQGWFVVLRSESGDDGALLWTQVITAGGFEATDVTAGESGETFATLTSDTLAVDALMIPQGDGTVLLSYEIAALGS